jgi:hypothetical protein
MADSKRALGISSLDLTNIRGFRTFNLDLGEPPRRRTIFLGKNGTCKSTLLRSIAIGLADAVDSTNLLSEPLGELIGNRGDEGLIDIELIDFNLPLRETISYTKPIRRREGKEGLAERRPGEEISVVLRTAGPLAHGEKSNPTDDWIFLCGYGAGRFGSGSDTSRNYRIADSVATLFRYSQTLIDPELTLRRLKDALDEPTYDAVLKRIRSGLGLSREDEIKTSTKGGVFVEGPTMGGRFPLEALADGYRLSFNWILDLYAWALRADAIDSEGQVSGILLIDEIEQHLHPSLQAEVLPRLSELFPKMQLFVTTHSPLVVLDAKPEEVVVLRREGNEIVAEPHVPDFRGYSAEDVLTDPRLFDTPEVFGSEKREALERHRELAAIPQGQRRPEENAELFSLAAGLRDQPVPESRESAVVRELRELVAKGQL